MRVRTLIALAALLLLVFATAGWSAGKTAVTGVALPENYRSWTAVAPSHRTDKGHIRMMLANPIMEKAYRSGTYSIESAERNTTQPEICNERSRS